jgi:PAS domain S-box-containing protein
MLSSNLFDDMFESLPDASIVCDRDGRIVRLNTLAQKLFEGASEDLCRGVYCQQFLQSYTPGEEQPSLAVPEPWLLSLITSKEATPDEQAETMVFDLPSGRKIVVDMSCSPLFNAQKQVVGSVYLLHDITHQYQKALHLQRVLQAVLTLTEAIAHIPEHMGRLFPEDLLLLSPPALFVAQELVDAIRQILEYQRVSLIALAPLTGRLYYVAGSGFTAEQEEHRHEIAGRFSPLSFVDEAVYADLSSNQEVILPASRLRLPTGFESPFGAEKILLVPLFLEEQLAGGLCIAKAGFESVYAPEEIAFVKVVAAQTALIMDCLRCLSEQAESQCRELVQREMNHLTTDFLTLASHELRTPLTTIKGNIQLTQRRLALLKRQGQFGRMRSPVEQAQYPLQSALQSVHLQERMLNDLIDDACLQANRFVLDLQRCDLLLLLSEAVAEQQQLAPERMIVLEGISAEKDVPIRADANRIKRVICTYLMNALNHSPTDRPVIVQVTRVNGDARLSVHDDGLGIPVDEQEHLWGRFYRAKWISVQHELDLSLGLGLYLCKAFIEKHHGSVGMQSHLGQGATFWFTLPIATSAEE